MPAGVPGKTSTAPVEVLKASCGGTAVLALRIEFADVAGLPLMVSPLNAFVTAGAPVAPFTPVAVSDVATTAAADTGTETVAVEQLVGTEVSQI